MRIEANHPALAGHFPGNPVVPGVVILNDVVDALTTFLGFKIELTGFPVVKFLRLIKPGQDFEIVFANKGETTVAFQILGAGEKLATGSIHYVADSNAGVGDLQ